MVHQSRHGEEAKVSHGTSQWPTLLPIPYIASTSVEAGTAAEIAAVRKKTKYVALAQKYLFVPLACEVTGVWCSEACDFLNELGSRIC